MIAVESLSCRSLGSEAVQAAQQLDLIALSDAGHSERWQYHQPASVSSDIWRGVEPPCRSVRSVG